MFGAANIGTSYTFTQAESFTSADQAVKGNSQSVSSIGAHSKSNAKTHVNEIRQYAKNNAKNNSIKNTDTDDNSDQTLLVHNNNSDDDAQDILISKDTEFIPTSFAELASMVGGSENRVTKDQLMAYLKSMKTSSGAPASAAAITVVKNLIAQFDDLSNGAGFITSTKGLQEPQDYKTITSDQVTLPIDVRI